jgi:hypothetical protein
MELDGNRIPMRASAFAARAPRPGTYRPDTICDGWETRSFAVRVASVRGAAHRRLGVARQDAAEVQLHTATGAVVFAVADGESGALLSDVGAETAAALAVVGLMVALDRDPDSIDWTDVVEWTSEEMLGRLGRSAEEVAEAYATTLVAGVVRLEADGVRRVTMVQIGHSAAWLQHCGLYFPLLDTDLDRAGATLPTAIAARPVTVELPDGAVLLVGTDGFGDPLGDGTGDLGALFTQLFATRPAPLDVAHALDLPGAADDRTLIAIWST